VTLTVPKPSVSKKISCALQPLQRYLSNNSSVAFRSVAQVTENPGLPRHRPVVRNLPRYRALRHGKNVLPKRYERITVGNLTAGALQSAGREKSRLRLGPEPEGSASLFDQIGKGPSE
jgi:hypothetical protein